MPSPEQRIREQRLIEATDKGYMGLNTGKIGCILLFMGQPVMAHGSSLHDERYLPSAYPEDEDDEEMETFFESEETAEIGYIFDGLSRGIHLEIKYLDSILSVYYKGHLVYAENSGDLECFFPHPEWEDKIEKLYKVAKEIQKKAKSEMRIETQSEKDASKANWLASIWRKWGFRLP